MPLPLFVGLAAAAVAGAKVVKNQVEKSKTGTATIEEAEARCAKDALAHNPSQTETDLKKSMRKLLLKHAFTKSEKAETPPMRNDWKHIPKDKHVYASRKYSLFSWNEYSFYTPEAIYYHNKKKCIHEFLYYDEINAFDETTGIVDYGRDHQKRDISHWLGFEKGFVKQISRIWSMEDETDPSVLEFCFNACNEFGKDLRFLNGGVGNFLKQPQGRKDALRKYWDHLQINSMKDGKIELQLWAYFPQIERVRFSENDSEEDIEWKKQRQKELEWEAEEREEEAYCLLEGLTDYTNDIITALQQAIHRAYGILYATENITILEEPDFTYAGPSLVNRLNNLEDRAKSAKAFIDDYADKHSLR